MHAETELKLLLPGAESQRIAEQLARHPLLRRRPSEVQALHNVYYDTPAQDLRRQKVALRVRRLRSGSPPRITTANPNLEPESVLSADTGLKWSGGYVWACKN